MYYNCILGFPLFRNPKQWKTTTTATTTTTSTTPTTTATPTPTTPAANTAPADDNNNNNSGEVKISGDAKEDAAFLDSLACSDLKPQLDKLFLLYPKLRTLQK